MPAFEITLVRPATAEPAGARPPHTDYESLVMDLCDILGDTDCVFRISGFGQAEWPVDVWYDLSTLVEQLPDALAALRSGEPAEIDLYGQGVERALAFEPAGDVVSIICSSRTSWQPVPDVETQALGDVTAMLEAVAREFAESLVMIWPQCAGTTFG